MNIIITGILGQDGANMAEYLLANTDAQIYGMMRRSANPNFINCSKFADNKRFRFIYGDLTDSVSIDNIVREIKPDYFINFGAQSFVGCSWEIPLQTFDVNATGVVRCLEAIRRFKPDCRFYSAGSSEELGDVIYSPQDLNHPLRPRSPYGASKAAARHVVKVYRDSYKLYAVHGLLFNHEGTKRGEEFVTRKISKGVARIQQAILKNQVFEPIELGNLDSKRDWSDSEDFVDGVWKMLNQKTPKDYVLSSDETHSIREFIELAFKYAKIDGRWEGKELNEKYIAADSSCLVKINPKFYRPAEVDLLLGDSKISRQELGWNPKISFDKLVEKMVNFDIENSYNNVS
jgi:GDPmannose 4,6-dehydratase